MNAADSIADGAIAAPPRTPAPPTRRVVDAPVRALHWLMALCFIGAYASADGERWQWLHVSFGYTLAGLLAARLLWGTLGPRPARLSGLWRRVSGLPAWTRSTLAGRVDLRQGQNLLLAASVLAVLALIAPLTLSGLAVYQKWAGHWLEELHESLGDALLALVLLHVVTVLTLSLLRRRNLVTPMLSGRAPGAGPDLVKRPHAGVAAVLVAAVLAFWAWQWQTAPAPGAAGHGAHAAQSHHHDDDDEDD